MARPAVHALTERIYADLPEFYRDADEALDYPLLAFLSLVFDQLGAVSDLIDRIDYIAPDTPDYDPLLDAGDTSQLVDPATADPAWLPWLAQLVGIRLNPRLSVADQRAAIAGHSGGWDTGTRAAIAAAAATALTGSRYVSVRPTGPWEITIYTSPDETASAAAVIAAVEAADVRPAGTVLVHSFYAASWDTIEARYLTWDALEAGAPTWSAVEATQ